MKTTFINEGKRGFYIEVRSNDDDWVLAAEIRNVWRPLGFGFLWHASSGTLNIYLPFIHIDILTPFQ